MPDHLTELRRSRLVYLPILLLAILAVVLVDRWIMMIMRIRESEFCNMNGWVWQNAPPSAKAWNDNMGVFCDQVVPVTGMIGYATILAFFGVGIHYLLDQE
jgi:hypothetical protein